jgi:hypothetical protein
MWYDRCKNYFMPNAARKYSGFDYFWRAAASSVLCMGVTTLFTYPLDLIHTRTSVDMTGRNKTRQYTTTFDCFNRTNLDETRTGLYKGVEVAVLSSLIKASLTLPVYDLVKRTQGKSDESTFMTRIGCSMLSGALISTLLYPLDTIKRCAQLNGARGNLNLYPTPLDTVLKIPS